MGGTPSKQTVAAIRFAVAQETIVQCGLAIHIAFALYAFVGDGEISDTYRGFWSTIMDILFEGSAVRDTLFKDSSVADILCKGNGREMEADQRELDANVIGQEVDVIVNVLNSVDRGCVTAICRRAAVEDGVVRADWTPPVVVIVFELVFDSIYELSFADKAVALGNPTFVRIAVTCILTGIIVAVNITANEVVVGDVMTVLGCYLEIVRRLAESMETRETG